MKQRTLFLCLILTFAILLGVTACKSNDEGTVETTAEQTTVPSIQETTVKETTATETTDTTATTVSTTAATEATLPPNSPEPLQIEINAARDELINKGWTNGDVEIIEGEPDRNRWNIIPNPYNLKPGEILYTVIGHSPYTVIVPSVGDVLVVSACVRIVYDTQTNQAYRAEIFYMQLARSMQGVNLKGAFPEQAESKEIVPANNEKLIHYFTP